MRLPRKFLLRSRMRKPGKRVSLRSGISSVGMAREALEEDAKGETLPLSDLL